MPPLTACIFQCLFPRNTSRCALNILCCLTNVVELESKEFEVVQVSVLPAWVYGRVHVLLTGKFLISSMLSKIRRTHLSCSLLVFSGAWSISKASLKLCAFLWSQLTCFHISILSLEPGTQLLARVWVSAHAASIWPSPASRTVGCNKTNNLK